ncbi:methyltransferase [Streptomyces sp. UNOB3_S3]|uniref:methyltransferase n=1 Tax=Streptomyces sp. UNOB3_S3 TaxID=2871682 RepID=UPI001E4CDF82|nr:methyltransferase [Streptomyces sp. UNOB3_S3]MCC3777543.1 methyltransferase [Streptomyces sp. UNOB3_S3]
MTVDEAFARLLSLKDTMTPWALRAVATLGVPDLLADGELGVAELARRAGVVPDALHRVLRLLTARGVFTEPTPGVFGPTSLSRLLESGGRPMSMGPWLDLEGAIGRGDRACVHILEALRTGRPVYERVYGRPVWEDLAADPALTASFDAAMAARAAALAPAVATGYGWPAARHVLDAGGGTGTVLAEVLRSHPHLRGTLLDRAPAVATARTTWGDTPEGRRCAFTPGSFFDALPAGADVILLANVVHDWPDEHAAVLLRRCAEALPPGGRVLIAEHLREGDGGAGAGLLELDLLMLLVYGGRERDADEFRELGERAGLRLEGAAEAGGGLSLLEFLHGSARSA